MQSEKKNFDDLMFEYFTGIISESDQAQLIELVTTNIELKKQFDEMSKLRAVAFIPSIEKEKESNFEQLLERINRPDVNAAKIFTKPRSFVHSFVRIAAIIALVVSVSVATFYVYHDLRSPNDTAFWYETISPIGSQTKIILPDSTVVWLNSGSTLKYNRSFGKKSREVALTGEGYFEVKTDRKKPFVVQTDSININVLGTVFNLRAFKEDATVVINLMEGLVGISLPGSKNDEAVVTMQPNEMIVFNKQTKKIKRTETDASRSALWTTGKLCFVDATLDQITKDLERKYDVKINITNERVKKEVFSGSLNLNHSLKEVLMYLDVDKKFNIEQKGDTVLIKVKP